MMRKLIFFGLVHILVSVLLAYLGALVFGALTPFLAGFSLVASMALVLVLSRRTEFDPGSWLPAFRPNGLVVLLLLFIVFVGLRHLLWLFYYSDHSYRTLLQNNLGDLPLHINYIRQLAGGAAFPPVNPEYAAQPLYYPFALDFYNALWESLGVPLPSHLFLVGAFLLFATVYMLYAWAGWLGVGGFFLNGGWAGWQFLESLQLADYLADMSWKNFTLSLFITQRGLMMAIPLGLLVLMPLRARLAERKPATASGQWLAGLCWGGLAFFHLHAFFIVSLILAGFCVLYRSVRPVLALLPVAVPLGAWFVLYSTEFLQKAGVTYLQWGWTAGDIPLPYFWWTNLGPWLLLLVLLALALVWRRKTLLLGEVVLYAGLFLLFTTVMMAPWDWDNIKLLIWPYLGVLGVAHRYLDGELAQLRSATLRSFALPLGFLAALVLFLSGTVSVLSSLNPARSGVLIYNSRDLWNMEGAVSGLSPDSVFLAAPTYNHPLTYFGRIRVLGYEGHTWSHGIDSTEVARKQEQIYRGDPDWQRLLTELGATHIALGPQEVAQYQTPVPPWALVLKNISPVPDYAVYEVVSP